MFSPGNLRPEELRMPFGNEGLEEITGLALSGGGFRAALFHLGSLWRLNELGYLPKLDRISSVSGGSITSGLLAVRWGQLGFANDIATQLPDQIVRPLRDFCARLVDGPAVGEGALLPWRDVSEVIERVYRTHLFGPATLQDLPERPRFIFNSTNFMTGVDFRPGPVDIAIQGQWQGTTLGLKGGSGPDFNHAKVGVGVGVGVLGTKHYAIFGDLNQQGALSGNCASSQNGRGGLFYVVDDEALFDSVGETDRKRPTERHRADE
jgi:hypothetical protein